MEVVGNPFWSGNAKKEFSPLWSKSKQEGSGGAWWDSEEGHGRVGIDNLPGSPTSEEGVCIGVLQVSGYGSNAGHGNYAYVLWPCLTGLVLRDAKTPIHLAQAPRKNGSLTELGSEVSVLFFHEVPQFTWLLTSQWCRISSIKSMNTYEMCDQSITLTRLGSSLQQKTMEGRSGVRRTCSEWPRSMAPSIT